MRCQLAERVEKALVKFGFSEVNASGDCHGEVKLTGTVANPNDRALACAVVCTTPGVRTFSVKITVAESEFVRAREGDHRGS